jgi:hypothetical protein
MSFLLTIFYDLNLLERHKIYQIIEDKAILKLEKEQFLKNLHDSYSF